MLLGLIAITIGVIILLAISGKLYDVISSITGKSECEIKFLLAAPTKKGGVQFVEPNCAPHFVTIDENYINANKARAEKTIDDYVTKMDNGGKYTDLPEYTVYKNYFSKSKSDQSVLNEWVVDEAVAKEMKYCWDITGRGKLDLFDEWYLFINCKKEDGVTPCTSKSDANLMTQKRWEDAVVNVANMAVPWRWGIERPPTFCVLCSRMKFAPEVRESFSNKNINNFNSWLDNNPASESGSFSKVPYSTYLQSEEYRGIFLPAYNYSVNEPYAVVYARVNVNYLNKWINTVGAYTGIVGKEPEFVQIIKLVPYNNLRDECTALVSG